MTFYVSTAVAQRWEAQTSKKVTKYDVLARVIGSFQEVESIQKLIEESTVSTSVSNGLLPPDPKAVRLLGGAGIGVSSKGVQVNMTPEQRAALDAIGAKLGEVLGRETRSWVAPLLNDRLPGTKEKHPSKNKQS